MAKTALEMLTELSEFFYTAPQEDARIMWNVLTALRGPDEGCAEATKASSTAVLRAKFFSLCKPEVSDNVSYSARDRAIDSARFKLGCIVRTDTQGDADLRNIFSRWYGHFAHHARSGFKALGLEWKEVNKF